MNKCYWFGHDLETVRKIKMKDVVIRVGDEVIRPNPDGDWNLRVRVCLRCGLVVDEISEFIENAKKSYINKKERKEKAQSIFNEILPYWRMPK